MLDTAKPLSIPDMLAECPEWFRVIYKKGDAFVFSPSKVWRFKKTDGTVKDPLFGPEPFVFDFGVDVISDVSIYKDRG